MYERSAIVLERYFNKMFGYDMQNNIKTNFNDYCELVGDLEKYKNISEEEETIMQEYDTIANKIRDKQKIQENLYKKNNKFQEERNEIFQSIDENVGNVRKKLETLSNNINDINEEIQQNAETFVDIIEEFNKKSQTRTNCGRSRRNIENDYNKNLNDTLDHFRNIDINKVKEIKKFKEIDTIGMEQELKTKLIKNGEKEKIPFDENVLNKAIELSIDIQKKETDIFSSIYDKTNRLFAEIKSNTTKINKHKKNIKDAKCKLEFLNATKDYLVQFLDNERLTAVNTKEEHDKLMDEACKNLDQDLEQIDNLYTLLLKETTKKITKKSYNELYNLEYLAELEEKSKDFDRQIKKLNLPVTIINPNYWRIEGMKKIYNVFDKCVTENYERDLGEYQLIKKNDYEENDEENDEEDDEENDNEKDVFGEIVEEGTPNEENSEEKQSKTKTTKKKTIKLSQKSKDEISGTREEIDKKIDMILGFGNFDEDEDEEEIEEDDDWDDDLNDSYEDNEDDNLEEDYSDKYEENYDEEDVEEDDEDEENNEYEEDDWEEEENYDEYDDDWEEENENEDEDDDDSWENQFVNIEKKDKSKKKKGFFNKFKNEKK